MTSPRSANSLADPQIVCWWGPFDPADAFDELASGFVIVVEGAVAGWLIFEEEAWWQYRHVAFDILIAPALHGQGYGREALRVAIRHFIARGHHRCGCRAPAATLSRARVLNGAAQVPWSARMTRAT